MEHDNYQSKYKKTGESIDNSIKDNKQHVNKKTPNVTNLNCFYTNADSLPNKLQEINQKIIDMKYNKQNYK